MEIRKRNSGIPGLEVAYDTALRFRDMITKEAEQRAKILSFWHKYGLPATKEAFGVSKPTLYRWRDALDEACGNIEALNPGDRAPKTKRRREIPPAVQALILEERAREKIGKEKLAMLIKEDGIGGQSSSTVGRMLSDLKQRGMLKDPRRLSLSGRTGRMIEKKPGNRRKKLRSKGYEGSLVKADTVVRFKDGIKRYVLTAIDCESKFAFAYGYASHTSGPATDFMRTFKEVAPLSLTHVQTDNGSEFALHFEAFLEKDGIVHFHTYPKSPKMNAEVERFNRTLSEGFISPRRHLLAYDLPRFNRELMDWLLWYNMRRPHWSIGLQPPLRYIVNKLPAEESHMWWTRTSLVNNALLNAKSA
jgi:transposase InsO family protein